MADVMKDGYYIEQIRRSSAAGVFKMRHQRNGNLLSIEWQNVPVPCVSIVKNSKVVNIIYL